MTTSTPPQVLAGIVEGLGVGVCRTSVDGRFVACNDVLLDLLGARSLEHLQSVSVASRYTEPGRRDHLRRALADTEMLPAEEIGIQSLDGRPLRLRVRSRAVRGEDGEIAFFDSTMEDVSDLVAADERLTRSHVLLDALTQMQNQFIAGMDAGDVFDGLLEQLLAFTGAQYGFIAQKLHADDHDFLRTWAMSDISWNDATRALFAEHGPRGMEFHSLDTLFGRVVTGEGALISNDPRSDPRAAGRPEGHPPLDSFLGVPIMKKGEAIGMVALANRPGGFEPWMIDYLAPLTATLGSLIEVVVADRERDAIRRRQTKIEELYRSVIEQAADPIFSFRDDTTIVSANSATQRLLKTPLEQLIGSRTIELIPAESRQYYFERGQEAVRLGVPLETVFLDADGIEHPVEVTIVRSEFDDAPISTLIVRDIGARKAFEQALLDARNSAERAARAKDELFAGMSHELRTPLNSVIGLSAILGRELHGPLTEKQAEYVAQIEASGRHLLAIIGDILDFAKFEADKVESELVVVEAGTIVTEAVAVVRELAVGKSLSLEVSVPATTPPILADPRRAKQLLINLLSNAVKFTESGGSIGIRAESTDQMVNLSVWDTGIGIPDEYLETIFDAFEQVDSSLSKRHEGTGLGLALSRKFADLQGGSLSVTSGVGEGSVFTASFRRADHRDGGRR